MSPDNAQSKPISLLIADERALIRAGVRSLLGAAADIQVVAEASNPVETQVILTNMQPRVALVNIGLCSSVLVRYANASAAATSILALAQTENNLQIARIQSIGAVGYVTDDVSFEQLTSSIRRAALGEILFTHEQMIRARRWRETVMQKWDRLTQRERQILWLLIKGLNNQSLSKSLGIASKTTAFYITNILEKLNVRSRQEAVTWTLECFFPETFNDSPLFNIESRNVNN